MSPDTTVKTAGHVAMSANNILNRASTLVNGTSSVFHHFGRGEEEQRKQFIEKLQREYINKETGNLSKEGRSYLSSLYGDNEGFREEIINLLEIKKN